jgi:hypothetical protein
MVRAPLSPPELAIIASTRTALGVGIGLLLADRIEDDQRRAIGWTLVGVGAITTIPIAAQLISAFRNSARENRPRYHQPVEQHQTV